MISTLFKHKSLILTICISAYIACGTIGYACPPPPECDTPDRYVMWAKNTSTGAIIAQSELGDSVYLNYYGSSPQSIQFILVAQNYLNGQWPVWADMLDYCYHSSVGCGYCTSKQCSFTYSGGQLSTQSSNYVIMNYNNPRQPLAGYVRGTHSGWTCVKAGYNNDNPYVISGGSQVTMNVYVVKVDILRNGVSIADQNPTVSVGEKISLTGKVEPAVITGTSPLWDIDNSPIKNYIANTSEGRVVYLTSLDRTSQLIDYYWYVGNEDVYVGYTVIINGHSWGTSTNFDVKRPSASISSETIDVTVPAVNIPNIGMKFYDYNTTTEGIVFTRLNYSSNGASGNTAWIQKINSIIVDVKLAGSDWSNEISNSNKLDGYIPYSSDQYSTYDSPDHIATHSNIAGLKVNDNFSMWLMFKANSANSIYIPLAKVNWYWRPKLENEPPWTLTDDFSRNPSGSYISDICTSDFPTWDGTL